MKKNLMKAVFVVILLLFINFIVIGVLNILNISFTDYSEIGNVETFKLKENSVFTILLDRNEKNIYSFSLKSLNDKPISLLYEDSHSSYSIFVNGKLKVQNRDIFLENYDDNIAYGIFEINKEDYKKNKNEFVADIELVKDAKTVKLNDKSIFFAGNRNRIIDMLLFRAAYNSAMMMCFFVIFIISIIMYCRYRTSYMLITLLISFVSVLKSVIIGEIPLFNNVFKISSGTIFYYETLTGIVNFFLCQVLFYDLFQIKVKKNYIRIYLFAFFIFESAYIIFHNLLFLMVMHFIGSFLIIIMGIKAYVNGKKYSPLMMTTYSIFSGSVIYRFLITFGVFKRGYFSVMIPSPQLGNLIYILGFLFSVVMIYFDKLKEFEIQKKNYEKITLLRGISHDLKLPLSVIKLNNQMIERYEMSEDEKRDCAKISLEAIFELEKMTENISDYLNANSIIDEGYSMSFQDLFRNIQRHYENYSKENNIEFIVKVPDNDIILKVNPIRFDRILYNLVDNAFKYNKENGMVKVYGNVGDRITLVVEDNGIGMDRESIEKIFEPFYRVDKSRNKKGAGLGLSAVKLIVEKLRGNIEVQSELGKGTKIIVDFPKK